MKRISITVIILLFVGMLLYSNLYAANSNKPDSIKASTIEKEKIDSTGANENRGFVDKYGIPTEVEGNFSIGYKSTNPVDMAFEYFQNNKSAYRIDDARKEFRLAGYSKDKMLGDFHVKLLQIVNGVRVMSGQYMLRFDQNGQLTRVYGQIDPEAKKVNTNPAISEDMAKQIAVKDMEKVKVDWPENAQTEIKSQELLIARFNGELKLVWAFGVLKGYRGWGFWIDAQTGAIIESGSSAI
jgi:Zn-dependent metalloprotease